VALPFGRYEDRTPTHGCAEARGGRGLEHEAVAAIGVSVLGSDYPYVVLVNVGLAELENLREWVRGAPYWFCSWHHEVKVKDEAVLFCFKEDAAALMFEVHCRQNRIPYRREW